MRKKLNMMTCSEKKTINLITCSKSGH